MSPIDSSEDEHPFPIEPVISDFKTRLDVKKFLKSYRVKGMELFDCPLESCGKTIRSIKSNMGNFCRHLRSVHKIALDENGQFQGAFGKVRYRKSNHDSSAESCGDGESGSNGDSDDTDLSYEPPVARVVKLRIRAYPGKFRKMEIYFKSKN